MHRPSRGLGTLYVTLAGVALATFNAWAHHDMSLVAAGLVVLVIVGAGAIYAASRRDR